MLQVSVRRVGDRVDFQLCDVGVEDYADEILNTLEVNLSKFIAAVRRGRERLAGKEEPAEVS